MKATRPRQFISLGFLLLFTFSLAGCKDIEVKSIWLDREILIDGRPDDWENVMLIIKDKNITLGLANDEHFLYLCLRSSEESTLRQAMMTGFRVWFDSEGGKHKRFGIKFPAGMQREGMPFMDRTEIQDPKVQQELIDVSLKEVEIIGPAKGEVVRAPNFREQEIEVDVGQTEGRFVYELKIPLARTSAHPHAIGIQKGKPFMIGFETGKMDWSGMRRDMGQGGKWSVRGGMPRGGRGPGGGGMGGPGGRPEIPEPLELWVKVNLAEGHSADTRTP
ncbi:MAG: hypothetical protein A2142_03810 [candidate division Zixibacteria bacterium RBG_16_48_11]|nr:MAG: hypothetical protein A2142_03810 [candidate division Zixibacteria bacterium RBG_16_48_11]